MKEKLPFTEFLFTQNPCLRGICNPIIQVIFTHVQQLYVNTKGFYVLTMDGIHENSDFFFQVTMLRSSKRRRKRISFTEHLHACMPSPFSRVWLFPTPWIVAYQAPLSMGFSRQEYWSGLPCPPPGDLSNSGIKPMSIAAPALQADSILLSH